MGLSKHRIGTLVDIVDERNSDDLAEFYGININKEFMPTVANTENLDGEKYKVIKKNRFVYSGMQTGRDECIRIGLYLKDDPIIVSPAYSTFEVVAPEIILPEYLFMLFLSKEKDRLGWFLSDSSIRSNLDWERFCEIELQLPDLITQQKFVDVYNALQFNLETYESGLNHLRGTCDAYIEKLIAQMPKTEIGPYISLVEEKNIELQYSVNDVRGISIEKRFIETKANMDGVSLSPYLVIKPKCYAYVTVTSRNGDKISIAYNNTEETFIVSSSYVAFKVINDALLPDYLFMFLCRSDFDRYARFNSWGSARETLAWDDLGRFLIPLPNIEIQQDIIEIFTEYNNRKQIADRLKILQKSMCPILIKGAMEEAMRK